MIRHPSIPIIPVEGSGVPDGGYTHGIDRRAFLKVMAASAALAGAGCSGPPQEKIVPYVQMPELMVPGQPAYYASAFVRRGIAQGVLIESNMGRPTKIEGNPHHPSSLGATDVFAQASILQLWDPDRSQTVYNSEILSTWTAFEEALQIRRAMHEGDGGAGMRILTGSMSSPTLASQLAALLARYPQARWHCFDPLHDDAAYDAAMHAFGRPVDTVWMPGRAAVMLTVDADMFGNFAGGMRYARDFAAHRAGNVQMHIPANRLYAIEATPTITGAFADNRLTLAPHDIERMLWRIAARLGMPEAPPDVPAPSHDNAEKWELALARELSAHAGTSLVAAGGSVSPNTRALVHRINAHLGNIGKTVMHIEPVAAAPQNHAHSISALAADMHAGAVSSLYILDANPAYNAPADLRFADAMRKLPFSVHLGLYRDETARLSTWHLPQSHQYEHWSDARAHDGTVTIMQPAIAPLYGGKSAHELIAQIVNDTERSGHAIVRRYWQRERGAENFESFWQSALRKGLMPDSMHQDLKLPAGMAVPPQSFDGPALRPLFVSDPSTAGGEFANNAWLQELPRPLTKLTWDNAAFISAATAQVHELATGDVVLLTLGGSSGVSVEAPVWILPDQADKVVTLPLGYGRRAAGRVGDNVGFDAYRLRTLDASRGAVELSIRKTGRRHTFASTRDHASMEGRDIVRMATLEEYLGNPQFATGKARDRVPDVSLYPAEWEYKDYKWGMAINLNSCIGCNACTIACQAENNIPVVGKEEVIRGREMHWIRVDRYTVDAAKRTRTVFQPVPCMHCEDAPCEEVCPVGATVHDSEGLNVQVYNRCVGTRFCSNNCPYKVRRFNFLQYSNTKVESLKALQNPEVTVRRRGVMEKCSYCLQRITRARIGAEKLGRPLRDGEVVTACQAVCPTEAIVFGNLNDPAGKVNRAKASPLDYALLAELNTRPRTTYAARVINPDTELD